MAHMLLWILTAHVSLRAGGQVLIRICYQSFHYQQQGLLYGRPQRCDRFHNVVNLQVKNLASRVQGLN